MHTCFNTLLSHTSFSESYFMLRLFLMFILALAHRISGCRATYRFVPKQGQAAKPTAIESALFVEVSITLLQKINDCPLSHGQRNSITVEPSGVLFEYVCPLYCPLTSPRPLSPLSSSQRHKRKVSHLPVEMKHPHTYTPHRDQTKSPDPNLAYQILTPSTHTKATKHPTLSQSANLKTSKL
jgi:hypothetical protein